MVANGRRRRRFSCSEANGRRRRSSPCSEANGRRRKRFPFTPFHFPPNKFYSNLSFFYFLFFSLILTFYSTMVLAVTYAFPRFPLHISYDRAFDVTSSLHFIVDSIWLKISSFFLEIMASHMATSYEP